MGTGDRTAGDATRPWRLRASLLVVPAAAVGFVVVLVLFRQFGIPASELTRDVTSLYHSPPWLGVLSAAGVATWVIGGALAAFALWLAPDRSAQAARYLAWMGVLALVVAADDQFRISLLLHSATGLPKLALAGCYGVAAVGIVWSHRRVVAGTDVPLLAAAGVLVAAAALLDGFGGRESVEDLLKFTGAVALTAYLASLARSVAVEGHRRA